MMNVEELLSTVDHDTEGPISAVHPEIVRTHILTRLDGESLASAGCVSSHLRAISADDTLWRDLCHQNWPSTADPLLHRLISTFPAGHRSFYSDAVNGHRKSETQKNPHPPTPTLISAVDIHYQNKLILSKIHETETGSDWSMTVPFRVDLFDPEETTRTLSKFAGGNELENSVSDTYENLRMSWIITDPTRKRAGNFSSRNPVSVTRHWLTGDLQVRFATVIAGGRRGEAVSCGAVVTCGGGGKGEEVEVKEVSFQVEDLEGRNLNGEESLVILQEAMESGRRRGGGDERERYEEFLRMRRESRERKERRERRMDMVCIFTGATIFFAWMVLLFRICS